MREIAIIDYGTNEIIERPIEFGEEIVIRTHIPPKPAGNRKERRKQAALLMKLKG